METDEVEKAKRYIELGRQKIHSESEQMVQEQPDAPNETNPEINQELLKTFPPERIKRIQQKELRKYKAAQDKKWRKWLESVSK